MISKMFSLPSISALD
jgi:MFS family permease